MVIKKESAKNIILCVSLDELVFLANAINETIESLEEWEFQTRTAMTRGVSNSPCRMTKRWFCSIG